MCWTSHVSLYIWRFLWFVSLNEMYPLFYHVGIASDCINFYPLSFILWFLLSFSLTWNHMGRKKSNDMHISSRLNSLPRKVRHDPREGLCCSKNQRILKFQYLDFAIFSSAWLCTYVSRAHEIEIRPSTQSVCPSVASIISEVIAWICFKF